MLRYSVIVAGAALLCSTAVAQQRLDPSRMYPITVPIKHAGTVDVTTGIWTKGNGAKAGGIQTIFNNTCTWTGGGFYGGFEPCEDSFDEGRVPSTSDPLAPLGAEDTNIMDTFEFSYCYWNGPTAPNIEIAFYDLLNGNCLGGVAPIPPPISATATAYFDLSSLGLNGSTAVGFQACWIQTIDVSNTGWIMTSDGDGTYDGTDAQDSFAWSFSQNDVSLGPYPNGQIITGEPATGGYGACSYNIPCGIDAIYGNTCGTGLDAFDGDWINVDGVPVGSTTVLGCPGSVTGPGTVGTGCYFFNGYPANPLASFWMVLESQRQGGATVYCTAGTNSIPGCVPSIGGPGATASLSGGAGSYDITCGPVPGGPQPSIMFYSTAGPKVPPTLGPFGWLCVTTGGQFFRVGVPALPGGTSGQCNGNYTYDFGNYLFTQTVDPFLVSGAQVDAQAWYRDPAVPATAVFSNALQFTLVP